MIPVTITLRQDDSESAEAKDAAIIYLIESLRQHDLNPAEIIRRDSKVRQINVAPNVLDGYYDPNIIFVIRETINRFPKIYLELYYAGKKVRVDNLSIARTEDDIIRLTEMQKHKYMFYDTTKDALVNKYYYGCRLDKYRRYNSWMEIIIAIGSAGSGVAGLTLWKTEYGQLVWGPLSAFSIVLATLKPSLKLTEKVEAYAKLYGNYTGAYTKMIPYMRDIWMGREVSDETVNAFEALRSQAAELEPLGDPVRDKNLIQGLEESADKDLQRWIR